MMKTFSLFFTISILTYQVSGFASDNSIPKPAKAALSGKATYVGDVALGNSAPAVSAAWLSSSETLNRIKHRGSINLAAYPSSIPFNFLSDKSEQVGYAWEISLKIADRVKKELSLPNLPVKKVEVNFKTRFAAITDNLVDLECASTSSTLERQKTVSFSLSNFAVGARLLVRRDAKIQDWPDLAGQSVAVAGGTSNEKMITEMSQVNGWNVKVLPVKDNNEAFAYVEEGLAQAVLGHEVGLYTVMNKSKNPSSWGVVGKPRALEVHGCVMAKGDAVFKSIVDDEIAWLMKNGEMDKLYMKYFLRKLPLRDAYSLGIAPSQEIYNLFRKPTDLAQ